MPVAALYLVCYAIFSYHGKLVGKELGTVAALPASVIACVAVWAAALLAWAGVARALRPGLRLPLRFHLIVPEPLPLLRAHLRSPDAVKAGALSAAVLLASTAAYGLPGVSLLVPLLLMKGGVLLAGPTADWLAGEGVGWRARLVMALAAGAVAAALWSKVDLRAGVGVGAAALCALVYVVAYFPKIRIMARWKGADSADAAQRAASLGFQVAEMTWALAAALPAALLLDWAFRLRSAGLPPSFGAGGVAQVIHAAAAAAHATIAALPASLRSYHVWLLSAASEGCALFGGLIFLSTGASTLTVPMNRVSSALGGLVATIALWLAAGGTLGGFWNSHHRPELYGAALMVAALWVGLRKRVVQLPSQVAV